MVSEDCLKCGEFSLIFFLCSQGVPVEGRQAGRLQPVAVLAQHQRAKVLPKVRQLQRDRDERDVPAPGRDGAQEEAEARAGETRAKFGSES